MIFFLGNAVCVFRGMGEGGGGGSENTCSEQSELPSGKLTQLDFGMITCMPIAKLLPHCL